MIFEVTPAHIEALSDVDLRTLVGYLAEREVQEAGHSASAVTYGGHQLAQDGGIDVRVALTEGTIDGFIPRLATGYQAKAEDFSAASITKEMRPKGKLRESIRDLITKSGAYIIVSSKGSVSDTSLANRKKAMADAVAHEQNGMSLFVDFYDKRRIATWVNQNPGIIPWVRECVGVPISGWRPFEDWSSSPEAMDGHYLQDDGLRLISSRQNDGGLKAVEAIDRLRSILKKPKGVVRLVGLSGVGKTRLVQALFDDRIGKSPLDKRLAVYADMGENPDPVPAELLSRIQTNDQRCVLIVDNCGTDLHRKLVARLSADTQVSLVTVEYDIGDDEPENTDVFKLEPASKEVIENVLKRRYPKLSAPEFRIIAEFSEGNFRVALALANTSTSGQSLANLKDAELFNRLFRQKNEHNPGLLRAAEVCSLVYSFDVEARDSDQAELPLLAMLVGQSVSEFHGHVTELKRRQLVQARARWRALLPHALALRLAKLALEDFPADDLRKFIQRAPTRLLKSFSRRLGCLHDSQPAQMIVNEWLSNGGMIAEVENLGPVGMVILDNVAPVHPEAVLKSIERAVARDDKFLDAHLNGEGLVGLLRSLAFESALFDRAIGLIALFARSKSASSRMGDAVNVFNSLFHCYLSGTHAPPTQRANFLRKLAVRGLEEDVPLILSGFKAMLECARFSSSYRFEFGARKRDFGFNPSTYDERLDWYASALSLADDLVKLPALKTSVRSIVAVQFSALSSNVRLDDLIDLAERFVGDGGWSEGLVGVREALRQAIEEKDDESLSKLKSLELKLVPRTLSNRIASYVLPAQWDVLQLADVDFDDKDWYEKSQKIIEESCESIGAELAADLEALRLYLPELLASKSERAFSVAKAIGKRAFDPSAAWKVIGDAVLNPAQVDSGRTFLGGFILGLSERDRNLTNKLLDIALKNDEWHVFLPFMQLCAGIDSAGCRRMIAVSQSPALTTSSLRDLTVAKSTRALGEAEFKALLTAIAAREDGLDVAIEILYGRLSFLSLENMLVSKVERDVARALLLRVSFDEKKIQESHMLSELIRRCLVNPEDSEIAEDICLRLFDVMDRRKISSWNYGEVLAELACIFPRVVLEAMLEPENGDAEVRRRHFIHFRDNRLCPLRKISDDDLLTWAREKAEVRFPAIATVIHGWAGSKPVQNREVKSEGDDLIDVLKWTPTALRLIHEAPNPVSVLQEFEAHFIPSGWTGSLAEILSRREALLVALTDDPDPRIQDWVRAAIPKLHDAVERGRRHEADADRERDERFDW
ncbi:hypothetical protein [Achromobacter aegrifaciens]|uniref:Uncharacterized protein n=1 Tax=Achromobacter aegrifaciens TaxID=1287736 RepID=A0AAD2J097_ACHAE|nr:hypothetical protein [Achromobacter aegrifaciens]CUJ18878.1 Uncharacterised protein [Achromobacter aegrifaciens]